MKHRVYHSEPPDFLAFRSTNEFPLDYHHVADVEAETIEDVFRLTNTIENNWVENKEVKPIGGKEYRSTSVGDIIVNENRQHFRCELLGWKHFEPLNHEENIHHLKESYKTLIEGIKQNCRTRPEGLMPVAFLFNKEEMVIVGVIYKDKPSEQTAFMALDHKLQATNATGAIFAAEGYAVNVNAADTAELREIRKKMAASLEDEPGRIETLLVTIAAHGWKEIHRIPIIREEGKIKFGEDETVRPMTTGSLFRYFRPAKDQGN
jgi:hypothetical protein